METAPDLPRQTRAFIVLVALLQGALLYLAQRGADAGLWPFAALGGRVCWYTLVLTVPTLTLLSVRRLNDLRLWQHAIALALLVAALSAWAAWSATGAPGLRSSEVLAPFGLAIALGMVVLLPWLQCRLQHGQWQAPYCELFEHAWQNALTLALAGLFVGICWLVLWLWGALFALVKLDFFRELFRQTAFVYLATGTMFGLGLLIGRTQQRAVQVMRQILFAICTGLLPLLAFVAVLFALSLPFTGLQPLWETRAAAKILIALVAALVLFVNAVYQDGAATVPYPQWLRRLIDAGLLSLPLYALLALYALWLRIDQYGWSAERFNGALVAVVACGYAFGYAWAALRPDGRWLRPLAPVNRAISWVVIALALASASPLLDPYRIVVGSQLQRFADGRTAAADVDLYYLRFDSGRRGYRAVQALRDAPGFAEDPTQRERLQRSLQRTQRWGDGDDSGEKRTHERIAAAVELRQHIPLAAGSADPGDGWWQALLAGTLHDGGCRQREDRCVLLLRDLDGDGSGEALLCNDTGSYGMECRIHARHLDRWQDVARVHFSPSSPDRADAPFDALRAGKLELAPRRWPDLSLPDAQRAEISPDHNDQDD
ncbi:DUF4153 domain-containing protein [Xanthomonas hyacinthi]|uniref:DUF4153 domain-containing protein n=1 Tax=Xanthomonas hyacinthi TaxID=56455 RepID=A0A2S7EP79_9XANT|nr:DUF4153 domain-containing protein [Xanthomonas hyacinthi]KLD78357.1 membrane protein [Xanthomonas hyacinthi DSM 19077]PPU94019.1 DUF4153 domain-containing protein [Xanthomonas hyacinthi]QGY75714.1 DUF4153 domain-containing protein [Xanthomonas hyacinthi]